MSDNLPHKILNDANSQPRIEGMPEFLARIKETDRKLVEMGLIQENVPQVNSITEEHMKKLELCKEIASKSKYLNVLSNKERAIVAQYTEAKKLYEEAQNAISAEEILEDMNK